MAPRKKTLRTMSPTARKFARLAGELQSVSRRMLTQIPELQRLDAESRALEMARESAPLWLDVRALVKTLTDELVSCDIEPSRENLAKLWNDFTASELHEGLQSCLKFSPAFRKESGE